MEHTAYILIASVVLLNGISKSAFAGALGVFSVPVLMFHFSAVEAITLMLPILILADMMSVKSFWRKWDGRLLRSLIPGAVIGIVVANLLLGAIEQEHIRVVIAVICIVFSIKNLFFKQIKLTILDNSVGAYITSAVSGISSTLVHAGGPPLIIYFTAIGLSQTRFVATAAAFFAVMNLIKLIGALSLGLINLEVGLTALAFSPLALLGNWLGLKIHARIDKQSFMKIMNVLLLVLGGWLIMS